VIVPSWPPACNVPLPFMLTVTKDSGSRSACLTMVFKLMESAAKRWRLLNGSPLLSRVIAGVRFVNEVEQTNAAWSCRHPQHLTIAPRARATPDNNGLTRGGVEALLTRVDADHGDEPVRERLEEYLLRLVFDH
jgi:hypothetical protein